MAKYLVLLFSLLVSLPASVSAAPTEGQFWFTFDAPFYPRVGPYPTLAAAEAALRARWSIGQPAGDTSNFQFDTVLPYGGEYGLPGAILSRYSLPAVPATVRGYSALVRYAQGVEGPGILFSTAAAACAGLAAHFRSRGYEILAGELGPPSGPVFGGGPRSGGMGYPCTLTSSGTSAVINGGVMEHLSCPGDNPSLNVRYTMELGQCVQHIKAFIFSVASACPIQPLPPITDPTVLLFESNPNRSDTTCLAPAMSTALSCLLTAATNAGGNPSVGSACRPAAYNRHLRDVWDKWVNELKKEKGSACATLRSEVKAHFNRHQLMESQSPVLNSKHITGGAVDMTIRLPAAQIDALAAGCQLRRPLPVKDRVHFIRQ